MSASERAALALAWWMAVTALNGVLAVALGGDPITGMVVTAAICAPGAVLYTVGSPR